MTTPPGNRRQWFRVSNPLMLDYEVLSEAEMQERMQEARHSGFAAGGISSLLMQMENRIRERITRLRQRVPEAAAAIEAVDEKLNALINVLPMLQHPGERLDKTPVRDGDLSASGIAFVNREPLAPGTCMYVRVMLAPSYYYLEAFARVVRCNPHEDARFPYRVAVQFEMISDEQRELLIRYAMSREAQLLRARRLGS
jgi:c-di-GMP-binding flagellar brake protein YcgR